MHVRVRVCVSACVCITCALEIKIFYGMHFLSFVLNFTQKYNHLAIKTKVGARLYSAIYMFI